MNKTERAVRDAHTPQGALVAVAQALDRIEAQLAAGGVPSDPWGWEAVPAEPEFQTEHKTSIVGDSDNTDVILPAASLEKQDRRRQFERQALRLSEYLGDDEDWAAAYAKGGPRWLYYGNRDLMMSFPDQIKQIMISDVIEDSPEEAAEIGRDLLKAACETGPGGTGMFTAEGHVG